MDCPRSSSLPPGRPSRRSPRRPRTHRTAARLCAWALAAAALPAPSSATQVNWRCPLFATNLTSDGRALDRSFRFSLGSFAPGFVPTPANVDHWAAHWRHRGHALYNELTRSFAARTDYTADLPPFLPSTQAYIWGCNGSSDRGEWILATHPAWTWPAGDPSPAAPVVTWTVAEATTVLGSLHQPGILMQTAPVASAPPPTLPPDSWRALFFSPEELADPGLSGWDADPDWDGTDTLGEYAAGTDPRSPAHRPVPASVIVDSGAAAPEVVWTLPRDWRAQVRWTLEESINLIDWGPAASDIAVASGLAGFEVRVPMAPGLRRFLRVHLAIEPASG
jgi:hypothetical protein